MVIFPDLVLTSTDRGRKLMGTVEVETSESVNHLEARAQWAHLGRAKAPFHLYVPAGSVDIARRLATENQVNVSEIWSYHTLGDQTRFTLVHRTAVETRSAPEPRRAAPAAPKPSEAAKKPAASRAAGAKKRTPPATRRAAGRTGRAKTTVRKTASRASQNQKRK
jgi:hypothetical protein